MGRQRANDRTSTWQALEAWKKIAPSVKISENIRGIIIIQLPPPFTNGTNDGILNGFSIRHGSICSEPGESY